MANLSFNGTTICTESSGEVYSSTLKPRKPNFRPVSFHNTTGIERMKTGAAQTVEDCEKIIIAPVMGTSECVFYHATLDAANTAIATLEALAVAQTTGTLVCNSGTKTNWFLEEFTPLGTQLRGSKGYATVFTAVFSE